MNLDKYIIIHVLYAHRKHEETFKPKDNAHGALYGNKIWSLGGELELV